MLNIADLKTAFGAFYADGSDNSKRVLRQLYQGTDFDKLFVPVPTANSTSVRNTSAKIGEVLQAYQKAFTPKGDTTLSPAEIDMNHVKLDLLEVPEELEESYAGFLVKDENLDPKTFPFVRWLIEEHALPKLVEDLELNSFSGVLGAITPGTATTAAAAMNGFNVVRKGHIASGRTTPIATGAIAADNADFVTQVEDFVAAIPQLYRRRKLRLAMSEDLALKFRRGMRAKYNANYEQEALNRVADYQNIEVVGCVAMAGSDVIWTTPEGNAGCAYRGLDNTRKVGLESQDRSVKIWTDFRKGFGVWVPELLFTNDLETV